MQGATMNLYRVLIRLHRIVSHILYDNLLHGI